MRKQGSPGMSGWIKSANSSKTLDRCQAGAAKSFRCRGEKDEQEEVVEAEVEAEAEVEVEAETEVQ